jgi:hypothetical protein
VQKCCVAAVAPERPSGRPHTILTFSIATFCCAILGIPFSLFKKRLTTWANLFLSRWHSPIVTFTNQAHSITAFNAAILAISAFSNVVLKRLLAIKTKQSRHTFIGGPTCAAFANACFSLQT